MILFTNLEYAGLLLVVIASVLVAFAAGMTYERMGNRKP